MTHLRDRARASVDALEHLVGGLATALLALAALLWVLLVATACLVWVGLPAAPGALRAVRSVADRERVRLSRWGTQLPAPGPVPAELRVAVRDPFVRRELGWVALHAVTGLASGLLGLALPLYAVQDLTFPLWYRLLPPGAGAPGIVWWRIDGPAEALLVGLLGLGWLVAVVALGPPLLLFLSCGSVGAGVRHALVDPPAAGTRHVRRVPPPRFPVDAYPLFFLVRRLRHGSLGVRV
ncbi:sensor domain-containing protein [Streptomyces microflavus]|uniref:sensor domain-containing protein n=1 Tax=Streptomyces microflavus TaxID=1919 RepID=UPI00340CACC4